MELLMLLFIFKLNFDKESLFIKCLEITKGKLIKRIKIVVI